MSWAHVEYGHDGSAHLVVEQWAGTPAWRVETSNRNGYTVMRAVSGGVTSAWYMIDDWWEDMLMLTSERAPRALRALTARDVDAALRRGAPGAPGWASWWKGRLSDALIGAPNSPLSPGRWGLEWEDAQRVNEEYFPRYVERDTFYGVVPTRAMPRPESGRVKFWRKHARAGTLPPLLLADLGYLGHVILDGHARAVAASAEGVPAPRLTLVRLTTRPFDAERAAQITDTIEKASARSRSTGRPLSALTVRGFNRVLIDSHDDGWVRGRARSWPLEGGATTWIDEVLAEALRLDDPAQRDDAVGAMTWMRAQGFA